MTIVVGCTTVAFKMNGDWHNWGAWLANAEAVQASVDEPVVYFAALEVDARGLEPFQPLLDRLGEIPGSDYWTFGLNDNVDVITTGTRLRRIVMGHNLVGTYAIEEAGASHVLFLASDTQARDDVLPRLLELDVAAAACHVPTYCLDGPRVPTEVYRDKGWSHSWDIRQHMETCCCMLLRRDVVRQIKWRFDPDAGTTDDPSMHHDLLAFLGEQVYSRHDVRATHWPEAIPPIELRATDDERRVHR